MTSKFSIKDLERLSGVKAHTIRIWELRYNLLNPERTDTNIRYYSNEDLKRLLNISLLNNNGVKISKIAQLSYDEITGQVERILSSRMDASDQINSLVVCMIELNEERFEELINSSIHKSGFEYTVLNIIYPFLDKIGMMWQTGAINPAQEHFISNLVRQKFIVAIDGQKNTKSENPKKYVLFLPEGELHELGLLFCTYAIKQSGNKVFYLGQSVPYDDLKKVNELVKPDFMLTLITNQFKESSIEEYAHKISAAFPDTKIIIYGYQVSTSNLSSFKNVIIPNSSVGLIDYICKN